MSRAAKQVIEELRGQVLALHRRIALLEGGLEGKTAELATVRDELYAERVQRIAAQRGLVHYMRQHGDGHLIGYDPDKDLGLSVLSPARG